MAGMMGRIMSASRGNVAREGVTKLDEKLASISATAISSGDLVSVTASGKLQITDLSLAEGFKGQPLKVQETLVRDAVNEALSKAQTEADRVSQEAMAEMAKEMASAMGGLGGGGPPGGGGGGGGGGLGGMFPGLGGGGMLGGGDRR